MPQPTPVWFVRDGDTFIIYTTAGTHKLKNLESGGKVALGLANEDGGDYFVVQGEAKVDRTLPTANKHPGYFGKYKDSIAEIGMTPEEFIEQFSVPIRVTPTHIRGDIE
jgi:PPOX class probable F420-dependent enzyme